MEIRAIYEKGVLKLLDPLELEEGQQVKLTLVTNDDIEITRRLKEAGVLVEFSDEFEEIEISDDELERLGKLFSSEKSVLDDINEDRGEY